MPAFDGDQNGSALPGGKPKNPAGPPRSLNFALFQTAPRLRPAYGPAQFQTTGAGGAFSGMSAAAALPTKTTDDALASNKLRKDFIIAAPGGLEFSDRTLQAIPSKYLWQNCNAVGEIHQELPALRH